jgi:hypothetical protein
VTCHAPERVVRPPVLASSQTHGKSGGGIVTPGVVYSSDLVFRDVDVDVARPTSLVRFESPVEAALEDVRQVYGMGSICHPDGAWVDYRANWIYKG